MNFIMIEYTVLALIFITLCYVGVIQSNKRKFITVKNLRHKCKSELERMLYDNLINNEIYVSPNLRLGYLSIPLALEPYKIAILLYPESRSDLVKMLVWKHKELYLRMTGWQVMILREQEVSSDPHVAIQTIIGHKKVKKI